MGTAEIQTVTMKDREANPGKPGIPMPDTTRTGDMNNLLLWGGIGVVTLAFVRIFGPLPEDDVS